MGKVYAPLWEKRPKIKTVRTRSVSHTWAVGEMYNRLSNKSNDDVKLPEEISGGLREEGYIDSDDEEEK
jgi:hypothetical protein